MAEEGAFSMAMVHWHFPPIEKAVARLAVSSYRQEADRMLLASFQRNNSEKRRRFCWQQKRIPYRNDRFVEVLSDFQSAEDQRHDYDKRLVRCL